MEPSEGQLYRFGRFTLDAPSASLRSGGKPVPLRPKSFDVLLYLVRNGGRLVSKDELIDKVWSGVFVTENSLVQCVKEIRQALGDDGQTIIETVAKRGYVFRPEAPGKEALDRSAPDGERAPLPLPERPSIAVLPFTNMSGDSDQEYFADGMSEDLITGLARIRWLFVIARNSSFIYKNRAVDVKQVSRELGVRYVLEGSVRRAGNRLRITAQLIEATTGGHHWAERYDRELGDIFAVQDEITRSVAGAMEPQLLAAEGVRALSRKPSDLGAWDMVARAQTQFWRMTRADYDAAIGPLEQAVVAYPDYAPAHGMLGLRLAFGSHMGWVDRDEGLRRAQAHAVRAITLDERDPLGHMALGYWAEMERRTEESIAACQRAVALNPNSAPAHTHLSHIYAFAGRSAEAIAHGEQAIRLSPLDPEMAFFLGGIAIAHYMAGRYEESVRFATEALRLRPGFQGAQRQRTAALGAAGRIEEARDALALALRNHPELSIAWIRAAVPYQTPELMERYLHGMRNAGLE